MTKYCINDITHVWNRWYDVLSLLTQLNNKYREGSCLLSYSFIIIIIIIIIIRIIIIIIIISIIYCYYYDYYYYYYSKIIVLCK